MEKNKFNNDDKMTLENAQQTESLRIVMVAVSELFHSISITQAAKEASECQTLLLPVDLPEGDVDARS